MSHITRVQTELKDIQFIKLALKDLEIDFEDDDFLDVPEVEGPIELVIRLPRSRHPIALVRNKDESYSLEGEQSVMRIAEEMQLMQKVSQRYAYHMIKDRLHQQGFHLEGETQGDENKIHLTLRRTT